MVKDSMDLLELLRKRGLDGDVDFLREALQVLVEGVMDAEVSARIGAVANICNLSQNSSIVSSLGAKPR